MCLILYFTRSDHLIGVAKPIIRFYPAAQYARLLYEAVSLKLGGGGLRL